VRRSSVSLRFALGKDQLALSADNDIKVLTVISVYTKIIEVRSGFRVAQPQNQALLKKLLDISIP
jgi:hypothetical protein